MERGYGWNRIRRGGFLLGFIIAGGMGLFLAFGYAHGQMNNPEASNKPGPNQKSGANQPSYPLQPGMITFAGETVPLDLFDVKESLDREILSNTYFHSQTIRLIKLANRFFPEIEPVLRNKLVPDDFKYLAVAESGLTQAVSPANAVGFWQLLEGTAKEYGLEVGQEVDERYHVVKSTGVACDYLIESFRKYGSWTMTAASYNAGRRGLDEQIERQKKENYYDLLLNEETARYLYRVISLKLIYENPEEYGFEIHSGDLYPVIPTYVVRVDSAVADFADFAAEYGTNYKILKYLNPWLRDNKLTNARGKTYEIRIPEQGYRRCDAWEIP
jgi:hypothetical protein